MMRKWCLTRYWAGVSRQTDQYFTCRARRFFQAQGVLQSLTVVPGTDGVLEPLSWTLTLISMPYPTASTPGGSLLRPFQPCFGDAESAAKMTSWMHYLYLDH